MKREGVAPQMESRFGFTPQVFFFLARIILQVNEKRSWLFCNVSLSVHKEAVVRMTLIEALNLS